MQFSQSSLGKSPVSFDLIICHIRKQNTFKFLIHYNVTLPTHKLRLSIINITFNTVTVYATTPNLLTLLAEKDSRQC